MKFYKQLACTKDMTKEDWLSMRRNGIGGSDAGAIAGMNPYSSAFSVYYDKIGAAPEKETNEAMRIGTDLEEYVAKRFTEKTGKKVRVCKYMLQSTLEPYMIADVDRMVVGENAILECKTTINRDGYTFEGNDFPAYWYCQCLHYLAVTLADRIYLAVLVFSKGLFVITIDRNEVRKDIEALVQIERRFWYEHVKAEIPPAPDGGESASEIIDALYPNGDERLPGVDLMAYAEQLEKLEEIKGKIKELEAEKGSVENIIKEALGEATEGEYGAYRVSWKNRETTRLDTKSLKKDLPDVYEKYAKTSSSRTFLFRSEKN